MPRLVRWNAGPGRMVRSPEGYLIGDAMHSVDSQRWIELFERDHSHGMSIPDWAAVLWLISDEYISHPAPFPVRFTSHEHRMQVYEQRAAARCDLKHDDDDPPPLEDPDDDWIGDDTPGPTDASEGSSRAGEANSILAA